MRQMPSAAAPVVDEPVGRPGNPKRPAGRRSHGHHGATFQRHTLDLIGRPERDLAAVGRDRRISCACRPGQHARLELVNRADDQAVIALYRGAHEEASIRRHRHHAVEDAGDIHRHFEPHDGLGAAVGRPGERAGHEYGGDDSGRDDRQPPARRQTPACGHGGRGRRRRRDVPDAPRLRASRSRGHRRAGSAARVP